VDRGFDPDAADPLCGLRAHTCRVDARVDLPGNRPTDHPSEHMESARMRPWSRHAMHALFAAWAAIARTYRSDGSLGGVEESTVHSGRTES
jgi:hypothetical protein